MHEKCTFVIRIGVKHIFVICINKYANCIMYVEHLLYECIRKHKLIINYYFTKINM